MSFLKKSDGKWKLVLLMESRILKSYGLTSESLPQHLRRENIILQGIIYYEFGYIDSGKCVIAQSSSLQLVCLNAAMRKCHFSG